VHKLVCVFAKHSVFGQSPRASCTLSGQDVEPIKGGLTYLDGWGPYGCCVLVPNEPLGGIQYAAFAAQQQCLSVWVVETAVLWGRGFLEGSGCFGAVRCSPCTVGVAGGGHAVVFA